MLKQFLVALKAKYPRYEKAPQHSKKLVFKDKYVQRLWEGFQLSYEYFPNGVPVTPGLSLVEHYMPVRHEVEIDQDAEPKSLNSRNLNVNELSTEIVNTTVAIIYRNSKKPNDNWVLGSAFINLWDAVQLLNDINKKGTINLAKWQYFKAEPKQYFLVPKSSDRKTHIWGQNDTLCRGWQNKAMNPKKYLLADNVALGETVICANCISHITSMNLKADLQFDSEHRLINITPK